MKRGISRSGRTGRAWAAGRLLALGGLLSACGLSPLPRADQLTYGRCSRGVLLGGSSLSNQGPGFVRSRPRDPTRFGTRALVGALRRAARAVQERFPGTAPGRIGDLSYPLGGKHPRHGSHRTGRDADVLYYLTDRQGRSSRGRGWLAYGPEGYSVEPQGPDAPGEGEGYFFDAPRNWHWVRTLLTDREASLEWIFCGAEVKARLLRWAAVHEPDPQVLLKAASVIHQPSYGNPHTDHFHVRLACTREQRALGCYSVGPAWPWLRLDHEKPPFFPGQDDDDSLVHALLDDPPGASAP